MEDIWKLAFWDWEEITRRKVWKVSRASAETLNGAFRFSAEFWRFNVQLVAKRSTIARILYLALHCFRWLAEVCCWGTERRKKLTSVHILPSIFGHFSACVYCTSLKPPYRRTTSLLFDSASLRESTLHSNAPLPIWTVKIKQDWPQIKAEISINSSYFPSAVEQSKEFFTKLFQTS